MFSSSSRYAKQNQYAVQTKRGPVTATTLPLPSTRQLRGFHRRLDGERLDHLAHAYLAESTDMHQLCDMSGSVAPDALAHRNLVGVPVVGS